MVTIYGQTDKLMPKQMLNKTEVGYYSVATSLCTIWIFVLQAIIDSLYPTILNLFAIDKDAFARNAWIVCNNKQKYLKYMYGEAACINVMLNAVLIPIMGAPGAALASLITQIFTSIILPYMFKEMRENAKMMIDAILLKDFLRRKPDTRTNC